MSTGNPLEDENDAYGYGLLMRNLDGRRFIGHGGGMVGYLAGMQADTDANFGAIVLQNGMGAHPMALARSVIRIADGEPATSAGAAVPSAQDFAGVYEPDEPGCEPIEITASKNGPVLRCDGREIRLEELDGDLFLAPDPAFDRFPIRVQQPTANSPELWHGGRRYVRAGSVARRLPEPSAELQTIAGHYRSHNPWTTNFRIVLRGDRPWLIFAGAPDGFDTEQPLLATKDGSLRVGEDEGNAETLRFDTVVDGRALRAWLSGWPYYRAD
jgi:hypothetical protein